MTKAQQDNASNENPGMIRPFAGFVMFAQRAADAALIALALAVPAYAYEQGWNDYLTGAAALAIVAYHAFAPITGLYRSWRGASIHEELGSALGTWLATVPVLLLAGFLTKTTDQYSRLVMGTWLLAAPITLQVTRVVVRAVLRSFRARGRNLRTCAIVGATSLGVRLAERIEEHPAMGSRLIGFYDDRTPARLSADKLAGHELLGDLTALVEDARAGRIDTVYVALPLRAERRIKFLIAGLADTTANVCVATDLFIYDLMRARWGSVGDLPVVNVYDTPFHGLGGWVKRAEDLVLSLGILLMVSLPMAVIALAVKLSSPGPVFFRQTRYGLNGRPIKVWKFRSMTTCDDSGAIAQATRGDARITPLGAFLRKTSLDELPQFFNVVSGEMSVVGPRPHAVSHNELYRTKIHGYMLRHKVKPGITGWAQVNGWRGETEAIEKMERRIEHDLYYIDNWSLIWDLQIVFLTIFGQRVRSNAY